MTVKILSTMIDLATKSHKGQVDKGGAPYILHPLRISRNPVLKSSLEMCVAIGHDLVEDCGVTYEQLRELGMPPAVVNSIRCLTKVSGDSYDVYKARVKSNPIAIRVKLADLEDNMDTSRLKTVTPKDLERLEKYKKFHAELSLLNK